MCLKLLLFLADIAEIVITGFNTDIESEGVVYHVQTEDKGVETPLILSLVYDRGTILASKRTPYDDLIKAGFDEKVLSERLQKQHKLICAAVRSGRIEELKMMTAKDAAIKREVKAESARINAAAIARDQEKNQESVSDAARPTGPLSLVKDERIGPTTVPNIAVKEPAPAFSENGKVNVSEMKSAAHHASPDSYTIAIPQPKEPFVPAIPQPKEELVWDLPLEIIDEMIVEAEKVVEPEHLIAADAVEIVSDLDLSPKQKAENLEIEFLNETTFRAGERKTLNIRVFRGKSVNSIGGAQVMVKVLGSSFRPLIFHARTNDEGVAVVHVQLPQFRSGRGAILVRAISDGEEAELRQIVRQS